MHLAVWRENDDRSIHKIKIKNPYQKEDLSNKKTGTEKPTNISLKKPSIGKTPRTLKTIFLIKRLLLGNQTTLARWNKVFRKTLLRRPLKILKTRQVRPVKSHFAFQQALPRISLKILKARQVRLVESHFAFRQAKWLYRYSRQLMVMNSWKRQRMLDRLKISLRRPLKRPMLVFNLRIWKIVFMAILINRQ